MKEIPKWLKELAVVIIVVLLIRAFLVQAYNIPSGSMKPTLLVGDFILVNKLVYKLSEPQRGDIVVFKWPVNPNIDFIKRIIGMPGDTIEVRGEKVFINGKELPLRFVGKVQEDGVSKVILSCVVLSSCTPTVRQAVLPKVDHQLSFIQKGSLYFSEEEERFIQRESQALGIPIPDREEIKRFINYYLTNRQSFELALQRANYYMPIIRPIIQKHNLPEELALLPVIESGFNNFAVSRSGAAGLWQFIPSTARRYGLRVDQYVDERFDVVKATDAAMRYLKDLYSMFGNWELALASYNCGENCVAKRTGGIDFWASQRLLPEETRNYVPAFFAVLLLANNPEKYRLSVRVEGISVAKKALDKDTPTEEFIVKNGMKESLFRDLNPHIKKDVIPAGTFVYVPKEERNGEKEKVERLSNGAKLIIRE